MVIAPQLGKLEGLDCLLRTPTVEIEIENEADVHFAMENYILHNATEFSPIKLLIRDHLNHVVLTAMLSCDEFTVQDPMVRNNEQKRLMLLALSDPNAGGALMHGSSIAKIKHPNSGMKLFTFVRLIHPTRPSTVVYKTTATDRDNSAVLVTIDDTPSWSLRLLLCCGCSFASETFTVKNKTDAVVATVGPHLTWAGTNTYTVRFFDKADEEERVIAFSYGLLQMVYSAYPQLLHIMEEQRSRLRAE